MIRDLLFIAIVVGTIVYFASKKKFHTVYAGFMSILIGAILQVMVSTSFSFSNAPPALDVMFLSTMASFHWFLWLPTLVYFILSADAPLSAVSGLLLGYGLGQWHLIRKKKIGYETGEVKRKVVHSVLGLAYALFAFAVNRWIALALFAFSALLTLLFRYLDKLPFFGQVIRETKRGSEWPGRGSFYFMLGCLLPVYLGQPWIVLVLALGDGLSTLIGRFFGYTPLYKRKSLEGTLAGFIAAWAVSRHFYGTGFLPAMLYLIAELTAPIDDNLAIPIALSTLYLPL